jgi:hypothetical protein
LENPVYAVGVGSLLDQMVEQEQVPAIGPECIVLKTKYGPPQELWGVVL